MTDEVRTRSEPIVTWRPLAWRLDEGERGWLAVTASLTVVTVGCWVLAWIVWAAPPPRLALYLPIAFVVLAAAIGLRAVFRPRAPRADWPCLIYGALLAGICASLFLPLKFSIPFAVPFWLDGTLASAERAVFGADPWRLADAAFGWATAPIDWLYGLWLPVQLLVLFMVMQEPASAAKARALTAYALAWVLLGVVAATVFASVGPIFHDRQYGGEGFMQLHETLRRHGAWLVLAESDGMWRSLATRRPGVVAGVSAMPSIHVTISFWIALTARSMAPRLAPVAWVYAGLIWIGSVQLGWHYVSDGAAGIVGMLAIWWTAGRFLTTKRAG